MFGTMGFSELIIILVIVLIIFGAGRLPQIGEGLGKALKGFKKEVHEVPPPDANEGQEPPALQADQQPAQPAQAASAAPAATVEAPSSEAKPSNVPYTPGPEATPGTTAAALYATGPQAYQQPQAAPAPQPQAAATGSAQPEPPPQVSPPTMEQRMAQPPPTARASYPALPQGAKPKPGAPRPSAVVNKAAVARVQSQQAAMKQAGTQKPGASPQDMQSLGEGLGEALRTVRQAAADVRGAIEPEVRTLRTEMDSAQKEIQQSVDAAKQMPAVQEDPPQSSQT